MKRICPTFFNLKYIEHILLYYCNSNQATTYNRNQMLRTRFYFSVLNKIRKGSGLMQGNNFQRCLTHTFQDQPEPKTTLEASKHLLSPYQKYLLETKAIQRPFTGKFWAELSTGFYHCAVCDTRLFTFAHKYQSHSGHATFFMSVKDRVRILEEEVLFEEGNQVRPMFKSGNPTYKRLECSQCNTHLGAIFFDGPPPSFLRYVVNSDMLKFYDMPDFPYPIPPRLQRVKAYKDKVINYLR